MRIAIDCRMLGSSGIGVYLREILPYLLSKKNKFLLIGDIEKLSPYKDFENVSLLECKIPPFSKGELYGYPIKEVNKCDKFYTPNFNIPFGIKNDIFSTIHDVLFLDIPDTVSFTGKIIRKYFLYRAVKISKNVFTVSKFSKKRIAYYFGNENKIIVAYNGISSYLKEPIKLDEDRVLRQKGLDKGKYLLYIGNIKKHKGLKTLLDAYKDLNEKILKLVIVGDSSNFRSSDKEIEKLLFENKNSNIIFTGRVEDETLKILLKNCKTLVQPSLYEGFGIPPLEALWFGKKPIISDIETFKEIYPCFLVTYFKAEDSKSLMEKICTFNNKITVNNKDFVNKYNYKNVSERILESFKM